MSFLDLVEESMEELVGGFDPDYDFFLEELTEEEVDLVEELSDDEIEELFESMVKRVTARGDVSRITSRAIRKRRANMTTGRSSSARALSARKAAKTRKRNPSTVRRSVIKRRRAMKRRKQMGIR